MHNEDHKIEEGKLTSLTIKPSKTSLFSMFKAFLCEVLYEKKKKKL